SLLDEVLDKLLALQYSLLDAARQDQLATDWQEAYREKFDLLLLHADPLDYLRDFDRLSKSYAPGLSDKNLRDAAISILGQLRSLPDYRNLTRKALIRFVDEVDSFPSQELLDSFFATYFEYLDRAKAALRELRALPHYERLIDPKETGKGIQLQRDLMSLAGNLITSLEDVSEATVENFSRIAEAGSALDGVSMPSRQGRDNEKAINNDEFVDLLSSEIMSFFYLLNDKTKISKGKQQEYFPDLEPVFATDMQQMQQDLQISVGPVARFFELLLALDKEFQKEKFSRNAVEFSDFEHGAFQLLQEEDIRREVQNHYDEIYIDEYQDTSSIQDRIVSSISKDNIFMVGDVKQSIYRFRYANPRLFQSRADKAELFTNPQESAVKDFLLNLSTNFRSKTKIINFVNEIFSSALTREAAEIEYDEGQKLYASPSQTAPGKVVWRITTNTAEEPAESDDAEEAALLDTLTFKPRSPIERLSLLAADTINSLLDQGAELKDIALLCCTNAQCKDLRDSLQELGIAVTGTFGGMYPENLTVRQIEAVLNVLDNPRQDVPLASYLASALSGDPLKPEEFMRIRPLAEQNFPADERPKLRYFHERVMLIESMPPCPDEDDEKIRLKVRQAVERIKRWRLLARERNTYDLLSLVLQETEFEKILEQSDGSKSSKSTSRRRLTELRQFMDFVKESSYQGFDSVQKLLRRLEKLRQRDIFPDDSELQSDLEAVRVLTYHRSKGLEWPYVILLGLDNNQVQTDDALISIDEHDGIRSYSISADGFSVANNFLNREKMKNEEERERAEAWRRLYVGMTRAESQLFLLSEYNKLPSDDSFIKEQADRIMAASPGQRETGEPILSTVLVQKCKSYANLLWSVLLLRYPSEVSKILSAEKAHSELPNIILETIPFPEIREKISLEIDSTETGEVVPDDLLLLSDSAFDSNSPSAAVEKLVSLLADDLPHQAAAEAPAKLTVTELKRAADRESLLLESERPEEREAAVNFETWMEKSKQTKPGKAEEIALTLRSPDTEGSKLTAADRGTHLHSYLRFLDLEPLLNLPAGARVQELERQAELMVAKLQLPAEARSTIRAKHLNILAYADSPLAQRVLAAEKQGRVYREMPFTMAVPAASLSEEYPREELTLIQGMIDLWFVEDDDQAVLVDFKSDRLPPDSPAQDALMRDRYALQISFYAQAIERATKRKVKDKLIWLLNADRSLNFD
ncbi:MAG: UvrD-helicase domain-containing protein, partial [Eubacteriales bacterium]|nr:UvrD-helicase domain-containing protein [Eubacteriales bacterium]